MTKPGWYGSPLSIISTTGPERRNPKHQIQGGGRVFPYRRFPSILRPFNSSAILSWTRRSVVSDEDASPLHCSTTLANAVKEEGASLTLVDIVEPEFLPVSVTASPVEIKLRIFVCTASINQHHRAQPICEIPIQHGLEISDERNPSCARHPFWQNPA